MSYQEMQFADPDWKPRSSSDQGKLDKSVQELDSPPPQPVPTFALPESEQEQVIPSGEYGKLYPQQARPVNAQFQPLPVMRARDSGRIRRRSFIGGGLAITAGLLALGLGGALFVKEAHRGTLGMPMPDNQQMQPNSEAGPIHIPVGPGGKVIITNNIGPVYIVGAPVEDVAYTTLTGADAQSGPADGASVVGYDVSQDGSSVTFTVGEASGQQAGQHIPLAVTVPNNMNVVVNTPFEIDIQQVTGQMQLDSSGATVSINGGGLSGDSTIKAMGNIQFNGYLDAQNTSDSFYSDQGNVTISLPANSSFVVQSQVSAQGTFTNTFSSNPVGKSPQTKLVLVSQFGNISLLNGG